MVMHEYTWLIVLAVLVFLIGSITWAMPTPRQRQQTKLRQQAMVMGIQVRVGRLQGPRKNGAVAQSSEIATSYYLPRITVRDQPQTKFPANHNWEIFRVRGPHRHGLPSGWCWNRGEGVLDTGQLECLASILGQLPDDIYAVSSNPLAIMVYWHEIGDKQCLDDIYCGLQQLLR
jgi:hypothetical protein